MTMPDPDENAPDTDVDPAALDFADLDLEAPLEDAYEQATPANPADAVHRGLEVDGARTVLLDDDDDR